MTAAHNTRLILNQYAKDGVHSTSCFAVDTSQKVHDASSLADGQVLVKVDSLSIDPHLRIFMSDPESKGEAGYRFPLGQPISGIGAGVVVASKSTQFTVGDAVRSDNVPWEAYAVLSDSQLVKLPKSSLPLSSFIGVLGMPSFTAYLGVVVVGRPKAGETLLVSAASGAVGQVVIQLAKARGLRVVGVAGSDEKVAYAKSLGADEAFNYKTCGDYAQAIKKAAPEGIDIFFDGVGGELLDAALLNINERARIVVCGSMTTYGADRSKLYGVKNTDLLIEKEAIMQGILYLKHSGTKVEEEFYEEVSHLVEQGKIQFKVDERPGLESASQALVDLFSGNNFGKLIVKV
ncbi:phenylpropenal double-bond reductase [Martensiomyces pterosporus]|nr:phenylpropenal double-bond reductase [Martensiomyces pterosporus]